MNDERLCREISAEIFTLCWTLSPLVLKERPLLLYGICPKASRQIDDRKALVEDKSLQFFSHKVNLMVICHLDRSGYFRNSVITEGTENWNSIQLSISSKSKVTVSILNRSRIIEHEIFSVLL